MPIVQPTGVPVKVIDQPPLARYCYFDKLQIWLRRPLNPSQLQQIERYCGRGGVHAENKLCWFDYRYQQRLQIYQPTPRALQLLARLEDHALLNQAEIAVDFILHDRFEIERWLEFFQDHFAQPWHRPSMSVDSWRSGGFSTRQSPQPGESRRGRWFTWYSSKPCRLTGEIDCFHFEGRHSGVQFLRRIGIHHPRDLLGFAFDCYFTEGLRFYSVDLERLGRYHRNRLSGSKSKRAEVVQFGHFSYNCDRRLGGTLYHILSVHPHQSERVDRSLQQFLDSYGRGPFLLPNTLSTHILYSYAQMPHISPTCAPLTSIYRVSDSTGYISE